MTQQEMLGMFSTVTSIMNDDQVLIHKASGNSGGKITAELLRAYILSRLSNIIKECTDAGVTGRELNERLQAALRSASIALENVIAATNGANSAATHAEDVAAHPTYIGTDNYIYEYDSANGVYIKTDKSVEASAFRISVVYGSVAELNADRRQFSDGIFALVNTGNVEDPDNARLYVRKSNRWEFLVDMSGAIGFTGKTPQLLIGTVQTGMSKAAAAVSLVADGTDSNGNPKYKVNFTMPCLSYNDLTAEQIADLLKPANNAIATLNATNKSITDAEAARTAAEKSRESAEAARDTAEKSRASEESKRVTAEATRVSEETKRSTAENNRATEETKRATAETARQTAENNRAAEFAVISRKYPIVRNGFWWVWDADKEDYIDTGQSSNSDYVLTEERILATMTSISAVDVIDSVEYEDLF